MYTQIRAIHAHDTEDSSAIATYKSLPQSMHDEIMMIYVPLGQIDGIWVREDIGGLALIVRPISHHLDPVLLIVSSFKLLIAKSPSVHAADL